MKISALALMGLSTILGSAAMAGGENGFNRRLDCRFYNHHEEKCEEGKKCHEEPKRCDKDDKRCHDGRKDCDDFRKCDDRRLGGLDRKEPKFCYASATYQVEEKNSVKNVHFGVGCDRQTIYDDRGTIEPQETVADHIRPKTAATPLIELAEQGDLRNVGTYTAKLEIDSGILFDGRCYVTYQPEKDGDAHGFEFLENF